MASLFPCSQSIRGCDCSTDPALNWSSEDADLPIFIATVVNPFRPPLGTFFRTGCLGICISNVSQEDADDCALSQAQLCSVPDGGGGLPLLPSTPQFCTVDCPDGNLFTWTVPPATDPSPGQGFGAGAAIGQSNTPTTPGAPSPSTEPRIWNTSPLPPGCVGVPYQEWLQPEGGTQIALGVGSALPDGLALVDHGVPGPGYHPRFAIEGTPTAAGSDFSFHLESTVTGNPLVGDQIFHLQVMQLTAPLNLPDGRVGGQYSFTFTLDMIRGYRPAPFLTPVFAVANPNAAPGLPVVPDLFVVLNPPLLTLQTNVGPLSQRGTFQFQLIARDNGGLAGATVCSQICQLTITD